jgi:DNA-binding transcriptional LysR family regulator
MREAIRLRQVVDDYSKGKRSRVRLWANTTAMGRNIPGQIAAFLAVNGHVRVELREIRSSEIVRAVREGDADVGIVMEGVQTAGLRTVDFHRDRLCIVVASDHSLRRAQASFCEILDQAFIVLDTNAVQTEQMKLAARQEGKVLRIMAEVQSFSALCRMAEAGLGIALLSETTVETYMSELKIRAVELKDAWSHRRMLLCLRDEVPAPSTQALVDHLLIDLL